MTAHKRVDTNLAFVDIGMSRMRMRVATVYCHDAQTRFSSTPLLSNWHQPCEGYHNARLDIISSTNLVDESLRNAGQDGCLSKDSLKTL
ncbi:hypothetical protein LMH87_001347 [Akanthomyces muscarius]|uniref:Uncharacterized protein n=1 Tax=Akanthomyces muscarius TaxID=2231603 RepID=A0A9W8QGC8_AKAMU|nr:hypothetical protein LMH87_001347 [Akanthomyces muscarius]KAJ4156134.1 hypothetical protein LMH87_001347 [Akanthomyces muscarius]